MTQLPNSLQQLLVKHYGEGLAAEIEAGMASGRVTTFRANTLKTTAAEVEAALDAAGIAWQHPAFYADAFIVEAAAARAVRQLPLYEAGHVYMQSLSAMIPPLVLAPASGENILDMAAAPGGKTCQMAALANNQCMITACEKNAIRAEKLNYNLEMQGARRVSVMQQDARLLDSFFTFDKVLLDSPCSGSGTILLPGASGASRASARIDFTDELLDRSMKAQRTLLRRALHAVAPGGVVVYSTCSILPEENELAIQDALDPKYQVALPGQGKGRRGKRGGHSPKNAEGAFLNSAPKIETEIIPIPAKFTEGVPTLPCAMEGALCVKPTELFEGFFVAAIKRVK